MDTMPMFPPEEFESGAQDLSNEETGAAEDVPDREHIDGHPRIEIQEEPPMNGTESDSAAPPAGPEPEAGSEEETAVRSREQAGSGEAAPLYESTGLEGPFEWDPVVRIFPDLPQERFDSLVADIAATGLREEITVAGNPPRVIDGKHREKACLKAGVPPRYRLLRRDIDHRTYVWSENGERRDLTLSRRALAYAELFSFSGPGRPRKEDENSAVLQNFHRPTQSEAALAGGFSPRLLSDAAKIANREGTAAPELRDAVRQDLVTVTDAAKSQVIGAPPEVQRQALALVRDGAERTAAAAVARVLKEQADEGIPETDPPTSFGENATFHVCSVADLRKRLEPATVDLIVACPPPDARPAIFSDLGALSTLVLTETGVMVVALEDTGRLPEVLSRLRKDGPEWIMELSLLFPSPIGNSGEPHWIDRRRVALLVCGRPRARLTVSEDVIEVPDPGIDGADGPPGIENGLALLVQRFASHGQVVCAPMLQGSSGVVSAVLDLGCAFIGADDDQSHIDLILEELTGASNEPAEQGGPG